MPVAFLSLAEALEIHEDQIARHGGKPGTRDLSLLKSALAMPAATCGGKFLHSDVFEMAAAYLFHIVRNHPFIDGNKRVGTMAAYAFLALNGHELAAPSEVLADFVLALARGERSKADVALFFREHARRPRLCTSIPKQRLKPRARSALKRADPNKISHF